MSQPLNAMDLVQSWQIGQAKQAAMQQEMAINAMLAPYRAESYKANAMRDRAAIDYQRNALAFQQQRAQEANALAREGLGVKERVAQNMLAARQNALMARGAPQKEKAPVGYRLLPNGNMEAIPGGPADLKAQADAQKKATGAEDVDIALGTLRDAYTRLEDGGGITSTKNSAFGNVMASSSSSELGQATGRMLGTKNQSARNDIAMARPALLAALMKATGMSAKQMDSNAELKLWLSTATDPTLDVEANRRALDNIEKKYIGNRGVDKQVAKQRKVVRTGKTADGRKVVQYEDGTIEAQ